MQILRRHPGEAIGRRVPAGAARRQAFSIQEVMVAVGVLGIGLIMVAAIFPVAMSQHRDAVQGAAGLTLAHRAHAILTSRIDPAALWRPITQGSPFPVGDDSPWLALPSPNMIADGTPASTWVPLQLASFGLLPWSDYANVLNYYGGFPTPVPPDARLCNNRIFWSAADLLGDQRAPVNDAEAVESAQRLAWLGFYRETAARRIEYAAALVRMSRNDGFAVQDLESNLQNAFLNPMPSGSAGQVRIPAPWRVSVEYLGGRSLTNQFVIGDVPGGIRVPLSRLAPPGTRMILSGWVFDPFGNRPVPAIPTGRVLTVAQTGDWAVQVLEDLADLQVLTPPAANPFYCDLWIIPPAFDWAAWASSPAPNNLKAFTGKSPVLDWVFF